MKQLIKAIEQKRVLEIFGAGTAAVSKCLIIIIISFLHKHKTKIVVSAVDKICYKGVQYPINLGDMSVRLYDTITKIQYGEQSFKNWSKVID